MKRVFVFALGATALAACASTPEPVLTGKDRYIASTRFQNSMELRKKLNAFCEAKGQQYVEMFYHEVGSQEVGFFCLSPGARIEEMSPRRYQFEMR